MFVAGARDVCFSASGPAQQLGEVEQQVLALALTAAVAEAGKRGGLTDEQDERRATSQVAADLALEGALVR